MTKSNGGPYLRVKAVGTTNDFKKKYNLRDREQKETFFKDLIWSGEFTSNDMAKGLWFAESKFWRGSAWKALEREKKNPKP